MPLYTFICQACKHEFEDIVRYGSLVSCPMCGEPGSDQQFPTKTTFKVKGFNAANNYSDTQRSVKVGSFNQTYDRKSGKVSNSD